MAAGGGGSARQAKSEVQRAGRGTASWEQAQDSSLGGRRVRASPGAGVEQEKVQRARVWVDWVDWEADLVDWEFWEPR